jgi:hypothetical protein
VQPELAQPTIPAAAVVGCVAVFVVAVVVVVVGDDVDFAVVVLAGPGMHMLT